jgi:hypothetical protein
MKIEMRLEMEEDGKNEDKKEQTYNWNWVGKIREVQKCRKLVDS